MIQFISVLQNLISKDAMCPVTLTYQVKILVLLNILNIDNIFFKQ